MVAATIEKIFETLGKREGEREGGEERGGRDRVLIVWQSGPFFSVVNNGENGVGRRRRKMATNPPTS